MMTDNEIIDHLRHNRYPKAIKGLYDLLPGIKKYVLANSGTTEDAKDLFQDALVVLYKKVNTEGFVLTVPLKTYLQAVARNCWLKELKRRKQLPLAGEEKDLAEDISIPDEPGLDLAGAAFNLLGEKCRQLLILFYFKKKTYREIATALSFSHENVAKNQKYRCIQKAKEHYLTLTNDSHE